MMEDNVRPPPSPVSPAIKHSARRRYRYIRQHKPHYYFVLTGISCASITFLLNLIAYEKHSIVLSEVAFVSVLVTTLAIFLAFFWGFYMIMSGHIPSHRLRVLVPHGAVGVLAPLFYTLNIAVELNTVGETPVNLLGVVVSGASLVMLGIQFAMGKGVVRPEPVRLLKR